MPDTTQAAGSNPKPLIPPQQTDEEIQVIEEGEDAGGGAAQPRDPKEERAGEYEYEPEGDEEEGGDSRVAHADPAQQVADEGEPAGNQQLTPRQRRRQRERDATRRERAELIRLRTENTQLRNAHQGLDARLQNVEQSGIAGQISNLEVEISKANGVMKRAMEAQNGDDFIRAQEIRDVLRDRLLRLKDQDGGAQRADEGQQDQRQRQTPQGNPNLTPQQVQFARIFVSRHNWYDPNARDQDSKAVQQIDNEMVAQGLNPTTPEYWVELERRVKEDLPHKFQQEGRDGPGSQRQNAVNNNPATGDRRAGGPKLPGGGGGASNAAGGPVKFHISAARKQALVDLGVWENPAERNKHIKRFIAWDKDNAAALKK